MFFILLILLQLTEDITSQYKHITTATTEEIGPIRIHFDYSDSHFQNGNPTQEESTYIKNTLLPLAQEYFSNIIKVINFKEKLQISSSALNELRQNDENIDIDSKYNEVGIEDTDYLFFIKTTRDNTQAFIAYAGTFLLDNSLSRIKSDNEEYTNRPYVGFICLNLAFLFQEWDQDLQLLTHEMTHSLVFAKELWDNFILENGSLNSNVYDSELVRINIFQSCNLPTFLKSEGLLNYAKEYFQCNTLTGLPLENNGGLGSAGGHWERRFFNNEYMTSSFIYN